MKKLIVMAIAMAGCLMNPDLDRPIMPDHPLYAEVCVDSVMPPPEGWSCTENVVTIRIIVQNPNP